MFSPSPAHNGNMIFSKGRVNTMKHFAIIFIIILLLQPHLFLAAQSKRTSPLQPLTDITDFIKNHNLEVGTWEVTMKKDINQDEMSYYKEMLQTQYPHMTIKETENEKSKKFVFTNHQKKSQFVEKFIMVVSKEMQSYAQILYVATGDEWNESTKSNFMPRLNQLKSAIFQENTTIFTCVKTEYNGIIDGVLLLEKFSTRLQIEELQILNEEDFISVTGLTKKWSQAIPYGDQGSMNVQFALREGMGAKTTLTFGTPVITNEY
ncbi:hypothetical protein GLW05_11585 [Pontibacillus yanchengensis]|uniref:YwmB family TATA-box binding protein n=2 Tax=Pontibacillus yanchengensis TaxID=462910 RepID=A0A6I5A402_9BACI|nr:hypothetical protein [Pontibacillus yanchengensis]